MPHIVSSLELKGNKDPVWAMMQRLYQQLAKIFNGGLTFGNGTQSDNISGFWANIVTPNVAETDFIITHNLGRIPAGYLVVEKGSPVDVFTGSKPPTTTTFTLQATVAGVGLRIFIF